MDTEKTLNLPVDITTQFQGSTLAFQSALGSTVWLIVAAVVAMYIVLGILYESFIHPITILSTLRITIRWAMRCRRLWTPKRR